MPKDIQFPKTTITEIGDEIRVERENGDNSPPSEDEIRVFAHAIDLLEAARYMHNLLSGRPGEYDPKLGEIGKLLALFRVEDDKVNIAELIALLQEANKNRSNLPGASFTDFSKALDKVFQIVSRGSVDYDKEKEELMPSSPESIFDNQFSVGDIIKAYDPANPNDISGNYRPIKIAAMNCGDDKTKFIGKTDTFIHDLSKKLAWKLYKAGKEEPKPSIASDQTAEQKFNAKYNIGSKIRLGHWENGTYVEVTYLPQHSSKFVGRSYSDPGTEQIWEKFEGADNGEWLPYYEALDYDTIKPFINNCRVPFGDDRSFIIKGAGQDGVVCENDNYSITYRSYDNLMNLKTTDGQYLRRYKK